MGGSGSGRYGERVGRKRRVEECLTLDCGSLRRAGLFRSGHIVHSGWRWPGPLHPWGILNVNLDARTVCLRWEWPNSGRQSIPLALVQRGCTQSSPWLVCGCDRVVRKLYLPPDAHAFACRRCYGLTYASQQEPSRLTAFELMIGTRCHLRPRQMRRQRRGFCNGTLYWQARAGTPVPLVEGV